MDTRLVTEILHRGVSALALMSNIFAQSRSDGSQIFGWQDHAVPCMFSVVHNDLRE